MAFLDLETTLPRLFCMIEFYRTLAKNACPKNTHAGQTLEPAKGRKKNVQNIFKDCCQRPISASLKFQICQIRPNAEELENEGAVCQRRVSFFLDFTVVCTMFNCVELSNR